MSEAEKLARKLARAQCTPVAIVSALVKRLKLDRDAALALVKRLDDDLADEMIDAQCEAQERIYDAMESAIYSENGAKGLWVAVKFCEQFCGWGKDGVDQEARKVVQMTTRQRFKSVGPRAA